jgi:hypothetical protein
MKRSLVLAVVAVPPASAGMLRQPVLAIAIIGIVEVAALAILGLTQIWLQRQGCREAIRMMQIMGGSSLVSIGTDGALHLHATSANPDESEGLGQVKGVMDLKHTQQCGEGPAHESSSDEGKCLRRWRASPARQD